MKTDNLILWQIYEIRTETSEIHGVMLRGRIRKFGIEHGFNVLTENASDEENRVRFAVLNKADADQISAYLTTILPDVHVDHVLSDVTNPVLSKLKVNKEERYTL